MIDTLLDYSLLIGGLQDWYAKLDCSTGYSLADTSFSTGMPSCTPQQTIHWQVPSSGLVCKVALLSRLFTGRYLLQHWYAKLHSSAGYSLADSSFRTGMPSCTPHQQAIHWQVPPLGLVCQVALLNRLFTGRYPFQDWYAMLHCSTGYSLADTPFRTGMPSCTPHQQAIHWQGPP